MLRVILTSIVTSYIVVKIYDFLKKIRRIYNDL